MSNTPKDVVWYVYEPLDWERRLGYARNPKKCAHEIWGDRVQGRQCARAPKVEIGGYGFCAQHAKKVQAAINV